MGNKIKGLERGKKLSLEIRKILEEYHTVGMPWSEIIITLICITKSLQGISINEKEADKMVKNVLKNLS